ncbi:MAG TPA: PAS domain-containing protein, partial [Bacteroidales bacterium]|nr:PAS domain-containing protein [Bacteroidales bacterium]
MGEHLTDELIGDENEIIRGAGTLPRPTNSSYSSNDAYWGRDNKYRMLVEQANDGITIIQDGIIVYVNPMMAQMHGGTVESIIGSRMVDHFHISEIDRIIDINKRRMAGENDVPYSYEA